MGHPVEGVLEVLDGIAPLTLAESWDNVGLLVPPDASEIERVLLTIDLSVGVVDEALSAGCDLIVAYHPPIFGAIKRFSAEDPRHESLLRVIRAGVGIYSPHTALDAAEGGLNDYICEAFEAVSITPLVPSVHPAHRADPKVGAGRRVELESPIDLKTACRLVEAHLDTDHLRVAAPSGGRSIQSVAVCAGAGGALFGEVRGVDLFVTGEMRHHDVLDKVERGAAVILSEHTSTERGFLVRYAGRIAARLGSDVTVSVSKRDTEILLTPS